MDKRLRLAGMYGILALILSPFFLHKLYANDVWKSLYLGRYLSEFAILPHHAEFAFSPTVGVVSSDLYSWLGHATLYGLYLMGSYEGLVLFRITLFIGALVLVHSLTSYRVSLIVVLLLALWGLGVSQKSLVRTSLFVVPCLTLFAWMLVHGRNQRGWLWAGLPVLFLFWSNLHGSYLLGVGLLVLVAAGEGLDRLAGRRSTWGLTTWEWGILLVGIVFIVILLKPYPDDTMLEKATAGLGTVAEYSVDPVDALTALSGSDSEPSMRGVGGRSRTLRSLHAPFVLASLLIGVGGISVLLLGGDGIEFSLLLPVVAVVGLGMVHIRFVSLVPLFVVPFLLGQGRESLTVGRGVVLRSLSAVAIALLLAPAYYALNGRIAEVVHNPRMESGWTLSGRFSKSVPSWVLDRFPERRVFNHYDIGGYLIWKWWPEKRVFIDSKSFGYDGSFRDRYFRTSPLDMTKEWDLDVAVLPLDSRWHTRFFGPDPRWKLRVYDRGMAVWVRKNLFEKPSISGYLDAPPSELSRGDKRRLRTFRERLGLTRELKK